jgi:hypothetical protein
VTCEHADLPSVSSLTWHWARAQRVRPKKILLRQEQA